MMPHKEGAAFVAQEGAYSASTSHLPVLQYFPARGRAEPIRLALAYAQQEWFEPDVNPILPIMRKQLDGYTFRQLPRYIDEVNSKVDLVQSMAILRHIARKFQLYGVDEEETSFIDMVIDGVQDLRAKLKAFWFSRASPGTADLYISTILVPEEAVKGAPAPSGASPGAEAGAGRSDGPAPGPVLACLERLARDIPEEGPWLGGSSRLTVADVCVFDLVDMHMAAPELAGVVKERFPALVAHHRRVAGQAGIKEYLVSKNRHAHVFADEWREWRRAQQEGQ